jgi:acyl-homoserine lactone acylase PvdQ
LRSRVRALGAGVVVAFSMAVPAANAGEPVDYASTAQNIIPSGQYGSISPPPAADDQAVMYDGLTPLFDNVTTGDLTTYFKSEAFPGLGTDGPGSVETIPGAPAGLTVTRDAYNVPHIEADTEEKGIWAAGYLTLEDRNVLLGIARYNGRVAALDIPGLSAVGLTAQRQVFRPYPATDEILNKQAKVLKNQGPEGKAVLADIDTFIEGMNAYLDSHGNEQAYYTRADIFALNAFKSQFLGRGGGDEARRSQFLGGLQERLGIEEGMSVFNDLRQFKNPESPTTIDGEFNYGQIPDKAKGSVVLEPGSFEPDSAAPRRLTARTQYPTQQASNTLMITGDKSETGDPLMVGGPQIGYFYPGFTYEMSMDAGDLEWRGATSAPFPGYMLIGRGEDFATTLTSASADVIDQFAEKLCDGSETKYKYKGKCKKMKTVEAGTINDAPVSYMTTVHGPVVGYATVKGKRVAIASQRAGYGKDSLDLLFNRRISNGSVESYEDFFEAAALTPQTFNSFYIDTDHVAEYTAGLLPKRNKDVDPGLPTKGNGEYEWKGFLEDAKHPQGIDPADGTMTNWNETVAHGFAAADDNFGRNGSVMRVDLLDENLERLVGPDDKWNLAEVTSAMNAAATQDVRAIRTVPLMNDLLDGATAPSALAQQSLDLMEAWRVDGGSRLDLDADGKIDDPGAAIMDRAWPKIADAFMEPKLGPQLNELASLFSRFDLPPGGQYSGWHQYFDRDIRKLLGQDIEAPFENDYCGGGNLSECQADVWAAIDAAASELEDEQGADPTAWRSDAVRERITFTGINLKTMAYTNRPSGIQQVISFDGHRP